MKSRDRGAYRREKERYKYLVVAFVGLLLFCAAISLTSFILTALEHK
jgi:hypothetical protein